MNQNSFHLSNSDISAILCALPLVLEVSSNSPLQDQLNASYCASAAEKLTNHSPNLTANETKVISLSISIAVLILSGQGSGFVPEIDSTWKAELSKYFFTYNRLDPIFQGFLERFHT